MNIPTQRDTFEVVSRICETLYVANLLQNDRDFKKKMFLYIFVCVFLVMILTKEQNIFIAFQ